jgi:DNA-binding XRE family transcriptional regulator
MSVGRAAKAVKEARQETGFTQQQLSFEIFESREAVSQQENGRYKVQPNITNYFANEHNNPWVAMEAAAEYINWGPVKLNGDCVDLHRASVTLKTKEELEEALEAIKKAKVFNNPQSIQDFEKKDIEKSIHESIDAITALTHYVAVLCKEYSISWVKMWTQHKVKLIQRRFLKK